ncbi:hypothetical protein Lpp70_13154 [Lacticaseibacillus paracasei subsp. paracasei Lpp70]|nr:hypothetical protein Lpp70_13154 [Lacticaseibacillus paracasei subsp. paracasei Lpp70]
MSGSFDIAFEIKCLGVHQGAIKIKNNGSRHGLLLKVARDTKNCSRAVLIELVSALLKRVRRRRNLHIRTLNAMAKALPSRSGPLTLRFLLGLAHALKVCRTSAAR